MVLCIAWNSTIFSTLLNSQTWVTGRQGVVAGTIAVVQAVRANEKRGAWLNSASLVYFPTDFCLPDLSTLAPALLRSPEQTYRHRQSLFLNYKRFLYVCLFNCWFDCLLTGQFVCLFVCLFVYFSTDFHVLIWALTKSIFELQFCLSDCFVIS